jgi:8-oxo-dGTP diphosphatase
VTGSGDGYVTLPNGESRWGLYGAAGLLIRWASTADPAHELFLLAHRSLATHGGDCWGIPGGALDLDEAPLAAALRELDEEFIGGPQRLTPLHVYTDDHGGWAYHTVIADADYATDVVPVTWEHDDAGWFTRDEIADLTLHPAFAAALPALYALIDGAAEEARQRAYRQQSESVARARRMRAGPWIDR